MDGIDGSRKTEALIGGGLLVVLSCNVAAVSNNHTAYLIAGLAWLPGVVFLLWGTFRLAKEKGYSAWVGLLGVFSILGVIVLYLLPNRKVQANDA